MTTILAQGPYDLVPLLLTRERGVLFLQPEDSIDLTKHVMCLMKPIPKGIIILYVQGEAWWWQHCALGLIFFRARAFIKT